MSIYLICLTTCGGLPILIRKKGECDNLPFSTIASLNGLHLFFKSLGVVLNTTFASNWKYVWYDFYNAITVIICSRGISNYTSELLPKLIFGAFSLFISRDEMSNSFFLERLKKESKNYMRLIDAILESSINQLLGVSSCLLSTENGHILQLLNDELNVQCGSMFSCLVVGHKIAVATEGWWNLDIIDRQLLLLLEYAVVDNDVPVYLPQKSPNIAYRFITLSLTTNSVLCVICGTEPSLQNLNHIAHNTFRSELNLLESMQRMLPQGLPDHMEISSGIVSIVVGKSTTRKYAFSSNLHHSACTTRYLEGDIHNITVLKKIFDDLFLNIRVFESTLKPHRLCEINCQFWSSDTHKYWMQFDSCDNIICLLSISSIQMHTMKFIGEHIVNQIIQEKKFCW